MLIIGSKALKYRFPFLKRDVVDVDAIATFREIEMFIEDLRPRSVNHGDGIVSLKGISVRDEVFDRKNAEFLIADKSPAMRMYLTYHALSNPDELYASPHILYSLKKSHIHFPVRFQKHIADFVFLDRILDGKDVLSDVTAANFMETESRLGKLRTPSLNKTVDEFFGQSRGRVKSYFIHDDMHKAVAHYNEPLYLRMQPDRVIAACNKRMWDLFSYEDKCRCVLEEAYVIALERRILPALYGGSSVWSTASEALDWALMRICTNLCSGWFRDFATRNYPEIRELASTSYVEDFLSKVHNGDIFRVCGVDPV
jgi:hypothetical protein